MMHWIVDKGIDKRGEYYRYRRANKPPTGSLVTADEIEGLSLGKAMKVLRGMYGEVWTRDGRVILCRHKENE